MKKVFALALAAVLTVLSCTTVFAAASVSNQGLVTAPSGSVYSIHTTTTVPTAPTGYSVLDAFDLSFPDGTTFPQTVTLNVSGVTAATEGYVLHNGTDQIGCTFGAGTVTFQITSASPFAIMIKSTSTTSGTTTSTTTSTTSTTTTTTSTSPKTGENMMAVYVVVIGLAAAAGAVVISRKKKA